MNENEIYASLAPIFEKAFGKPVALSPQLSSRDMVDWDSVTHITLIVDIEDFYDIRFALGEAENFANLGEMVEGIRSHLNNSKSE
jgi:acyl carrier protein